MHPRGDVLTKRFYFCKMFENKNEAKTPLSSLGEFGLIEHLSKGFSLQQKSSKVGIGR